MIHSQRGIDTILLAPQAITNGATATARWDCRDAVYATVRISFAAEANTNAEGPTLSLLHSDDTVVTNFATVVADRSAEDLTSAKEVRYEVDLRGRKRYLRLTITPGTTDTNDQITACAIGTLTRNITDPGSTTDMGDDVVVIV